MNFSLESLGFAWEDMDPNLCPTHQLYILIKESTNQSKLCYSYTLRAVELLLELLLLELPWKRKKNDFLSPRPINCNSSSALVWTSYHTFMMGFCLT